MFLNHGQMTGLNERTKHRALIINSHQSAPTLEPPRNQAKSPLSQCCPVWDLVSFITESAHVNGMLGYPQKCCLKYTVKSVTESSQNGCVYVCVSERERQRDRDTQREKE